MPATRCRRATPAPRVGAWPTGTTIPVGSTGRGCAASRSAGPSCSTTWPASLGADHRRPAGPTRWRSTWPPAWPTTPPGRSRRPCGWRSIGSRSFYTAATVDNAPVLVAAELVAGNAMLSPVWDAAAGGLLLLVGTNPVVSHGYGTTIPDPVRHLRDHRRLGGRLWVIDPRRTETAALADEHLAVRPGRRRRAAGRGRVGAPGRRATTPTRWPRLLRSGRRRGPARRAGAVHRRRGRPRRRASRSRPSSGSSPRCGPTGVGWPIMCGTGTTMGRDGILVEWLRWVLLILTGSLDRPGGMRFQDGPLGRLRPPRAAGPRPRRRPGTRARGPSSAGWSVRCRRSRWPTRSRPVTCGRWSSPAATRSRRSPSPTGCGPRWRRSTCWPSST